MDNRPRARRLLPRRRGTSPDFGGRYVGGKRGRGGDPVAGDILVVGGDGGRRTRWAVTAVEYPYGNHVGDLVASVWAASVRPAACFLRIV